MPSYLDAVTLALTAAAAGADALHPGYGFLAESPELAEACRAAGLVFVGAPAAALATLGRKDSARELAERAGVPVVPGGADAGDVGYPLLVKARAGGGGRGMRVVRELGELAEAVEAAAREAAAAFGDGGLVYERFVEGARHVEVQILRDAHGGALHLGERDCSLQRRHQKMIEEAPAPGVGRELRGELGTAALRLAEAVGYVGAGTAEFLLAPDGSWYFLEMNARLQVEHPVTELVTGIDLVRPQLEIAGGQPLELAQDDVLRAGTRSRRASTRRTPTAASCRHRAPCSRCAGRADRGSASMPASTAATSSAPATTACSRSSACTARRAAARSRACAPPSTTWSCSA